MLLMLQANAVTSNEAISDIFIVEILAVAHMENPA